MRAGHSGRAQRAQAALRPRGTRRTNRTHGGRRARPAGLPGGRWRLRGCAWARGLSLTNPREVPEPPSPLRAQGTGRGDTWKAPKEMAVTTHLSL